MRGKREPCTHCERWGVMWMRDVRHIVEGMWGRWDGDFTESATPSSQSTFSNAELAQHSQLFHSHPLIRGRIKVIEPRVTPRGSVEPLRIA